MRPPLLRPRIALDTGLPVIVPLPRARAVNRGSEVSSDRRSDTLVASFIFVLAFVLYAATVAPTITWGDDVTLTISAVQGELHASAGSHPLWVALAHFMAQLPIGDAAYRVNLFSALAASIALVFLYLSMRLLRISRPAALAGCLALAVSHTFWAHAVRAEVYTATMAMLAILLCITLKWWREGQDRYLVLLGLSLGAALATHVLTLLYVPGLALLLYQARRPRAGRILLLAACLVVGAIPLGMLLLRDKATLNTDISGLLDWALFSFDGYNFGGRMLHFTAATLLPDAEQWLGYLVYQFIGVAFPLIVMGAMCCWRTWPRSISASIVLLYGVSAVFAFAYDVGDRYVFYLPSYLPAAIWLALGVDVLLRWIKSRSANRRVCSFALAALMIMLFCVPVVSYRIAPIAMRRFGIQVRSARYVPGPNSRSFLLWPPKTGYYDARTYAEEVLSVTPPSALLLADPILASPLQYLQTIEGQRPDVTIHFCCWDIEKALAEYPGRSVVLADSAPNVYPIARLQQSYVLRRVGPVFILQPRPEPVMTIP